MVISLPQVFEIFILLCGLHKDQGAPEQNNIFHTIIVSLRSIPNCLGQNGIKIGIEVF